ncbi:MAG: 3',5'-cyclic-nucleotide phosphodiesterase [Gammaproteobacteria bacterium]
MRVNVLGCSGGIGADLRTTSLLIDDDVLIDCGTGVGILRLEEMAKIRHLFLTHAHLDHIASLPLMLDTLFPYLQNNPLTVHCQAVTMEILKKHIFNWQIWPDFFELPDKETPVVRFEPLTPGSVYELDGRRLEMIRVNHVMPCVGYRIENDGAAMAFSGDTTTNDSFWEALNRHHRLDLLIVECAFREEARALSEAAKHYCPSLLSEDLVKLKHDPRICITHLQPGDEATIMEQLQTAIPDRTIYRVTGGDQFHL